MKLDKRIIEGKKPLTYFDIEEARHFIGRKGYFSDCVPVFANLDNATIAILGMVNDNDWFQPFMATSGAAAGKARYFLPEAWVQEQEPEPEWRPYDLDTLREDEILFGNVITFRRKTDDNSARVITAIYNGKSENSDDLNDSEILLGGEWFGFQRLFEDYEIFDSAYGDSKICKWRPFGYQE